MVKIQVKLELIFVFTYYQLDSDYTTWIVEINDSICVGHLWAFSLWTMLKMNLNTTMNSDLMQIIWSKISVYIRSGCSRAWTKVDGVHTFLCMKISILYVLCTFLALQTSGALLWRPPTSFSRLHPCIRRVINIVHIIMYDEGK